LGEVPQRARAQHAEARSWRGPPVSRGCTPPGPPCRAVALESFDRGVSDDTTGERGGRRTGGEGRGRGVCRLCACEPRGVARPDLVTCPGLLHPAWFCTITTHGSVPLARATPVPDREGSSSYRSLPCSPPIPENMLLDIVFRRDDSCFRSEGLPCSSVRIHAS
jgi:hypothetical protein